MHIGFICHEYPPCHHGGIGSFTKDLAEGLVKEGFRVSVLGIYTPAVLELSEPVIEEINGVHVYRYPLTSRSKIVQFNSMAERLKLYKYIKAIHAMSPLDLIESPENQGWLPKGAPFNIPLITRFHGGESYFAVELGRKSSRLSKILEKRQLIHSAKIVSVSDHTAKVTLNLFKLAKPYTVIYNSVKVPESLQKMQTHRIYKHRIVFTGSVIPKKGVRELVEAMNIVFERYADAELYIAGKNIYNIDGRPFENVMLDSLEKESYKERVKFLGALDRESVLFPLIAGAEVCCFPSYSEAFALTPLESMAIGKAVIFTKRSSGPEAIEDGVSGLLCDPSDPQDIADKIMFCFDHPAQANQMAQAGQRRVGECFGYEKWLFENSSFYKSLTGEIK